MWLQAEMPRIARVTEVQFESGIVPVVSEPIAPGAPPRTSGGRGGAAPPGGPAAAGYPRAYRIETSTDGTAWRVVAEGSGTGPTMTITFAPVDAKFVRISQTATTADAPPFAVQRLKFYEAR
jgi:hypothetical protein